MEISVVMSTYKEKIDLLRESIESILQQTYSDFEFIIILDNPQNKEHIKLIKKYEEQDSRIKFFINKENMGLTDTLNKALKIAEGKYICRMDADDVSLPNRLSLQLDYLVKYDYDLIGGLSHMIDEKGNTIYSIKKVPTDLKKIRKCIKYNQVISHPTWFGKKVVFDKLGGYRKIPLCEDYDFTLRALLSGYKISNINEVVLKYRMTSTSISRSNLFEQYLYGCYITQEYARGNIADIKNAKLYVEKRNNKKNALKYIKANNVFNRTLKDIEEKKYFKFLIDGIILLFSSRFYLNKIYRFIMVTLYS